MGVDFWLGKDRVFWEPPEGSLSHKREAKVYRKGFLEEYELSRWRELEESKDWGPEEKAQLMCGSDNWKGLRFAGNWNVERMEE